MAQARILRIYLEKSEMERARDGNYNLMNRIKSAFEWQGFRVEFMRDSLEQRLKSAGRRGYSLFFMHDPFHDRALTLRRSYFFPYWRIESTAERWAFDVAQKSFDPGETEPDQAREWADRWRGWLFKGAAREPVRDGSVYVPLQGRLLERRRFQEKSPLDMLRDVAEHDPERQIIVGLHPKERYSDEEKAGLETVLAKNPHMHLKRGGMRAALKSCDYVVTENSSAALFGFFFHKPAILYARIDFHHIGLNVRDLGVGEAFARAESHRPDFDTYLYWFIHQNSIKADAEDAEDQILAAVRRHGWQV